MKELTIALSLFLLAYPLSGQTAIYKCAIDGAVTYQDVPCKAEQFALALVDAPDPVSHSSSAGLLVFKQESELRSSFRLTGLVVGMTDTEVLNLRGWGRPGKITRSREHRAWCEEWNYFSPADGQRLLHFANGRLTAIDAGPAVSQAP